MPNSSILPATSLIKSSPNPKSIHTTNKPTKDKAKELFVDDDSTIFGHVLNYMRNSQYPFPEEYNYKLDYYQIKYTKTETMLVPYTRNFSISQHSSYIHLGNIIVEQIELIYKDKHIADQVIISGIIIRLVMDGIELYTIDKYDICRKKNKLVYEFKYPLDLRNKTFEIIIEGSRYNDIGNNYSGCLRGRHQIELR